MRNYTFAPIGRWLTLTFLPRVSLRLPWAMYSLGFQPVKRQNRALPVKRQNRAHPGKRQNRAHPGKRQNRALPGKRQNRAHPGKRQNRALPVKRKNRALPVKRQSQALPGKRQSRALPGKGGAAQRRRPENITFLMSSSWSKMKRATMELRMAEVESFSGPQYFMRSSTFFSDSSM